jgi:ribosomal protein S12 methylthiotransferase accessory factor
VTQLDALRVPTYCAIRPDGLVLQVSNGKGLTETAAQVSALMEAVELYHAEYPLPDRLLRTCMAALRTGGAELLWPADITGFCGGYFSERFVCEWVEGQDLATGRPVWAPAGAVYFLRTPAMYHTSSNGLASGNHLAEATLHALYELIERDARARLSIDGKVRVRERALIIDTASLDAPELCTILQHAAEEGTKVVLLWLQSAIPLHTFWAVLLNRHGLVATSMVNVGFGTHVDKGVAAARALTEAAQSRLTFIHGAREDLLTKMHQVTHDQVHPVYQFFDSLEPNTTWAALDRQPALAVEWNLEANLRQLIAALVHAGYDRLVRFDLTRPEIGIPVAKVIVPGLRFHHGKRR